MNNVVSGFLSHPNVLVRILTGSAAGLAVFFVSWAASYAWLPEGVVRASWVPSIEGSDAQTAAFSLLAWNLMTAGLIVIASLFAVGRFPAGYLIPLLIFAWYGALLGTNSFAIPDPAGRVAPTLSVIWTRSGLREALAYMLLAAALANVHLWREPSWWSARLERIRSWRDIRLSPAEILLLIAAMAMLGWAMIVEGWQIAQS